jgi:hypothetical protein
MAKKSFMKIGFIQLLACCLIIACNSANASGAQDSRKNENVRIVKIPSGKMISSGEFGWGNHDVFYRLMDEIKILDDIFPRVFLFHIQKTNKFIYCYSVMNFDIGIIDSKGLEIIDFEGGFYATAVAIDIFDNPASLSQVQGDIEKWVWQSNGFELDYKNRDLLTQMPYADDDEFKKALGHYQLDVFVPIKIKRPNSK